MNYAAFDWVRQRTDRQEQRQGQRAELEEQIVLGSSGVASKYSFCSWSLCSRSKVCTLSLCAITYVWIASILYSVHVLGYNTKLGLSHFIVGSIMKICTIDHCILKLNCLDTWGPQIHLLVQATGTNANAQKMLMEKSRAQDKGPRNTCLSERQRQSTRAKVRNLRRVKESLNLKKRTLLTRK